MKTKKEIENQIELLLNEGLYTQLSEVIVNDVINNSVDIEIHLKDEGKFHNFAMLMDNHVSVFTQKYKHLRKFKHVEQVTHIQPGNKQKVYYKFPNSKITIWLNK